MSKNAPSITLNSNFLRFGLESHKNRTHNFKPKTSANINVPISCLCGHGLIPAVVLPTIRAIAQSDTEATSYLLETAHSFSYQ